MPTSFTPSRPTAVETQVAAIAANQSGAVSRAQALAMGVSDSTIHRRVTDGRWRRQHPGVYVMASHPPSWLQQVWSAYLAVGSSAVVSHESALHLHGIHQVSRRPITLTVPHGGHARLDRVFVHQIDDLAQHPHRILALSGLPVAAPERALVDVAAALGEKHLDRLLDEIVLGKQASEARVAACLREVLRPGKPGVAKLARVLDGRGEGQVPPQSELERALFAALAVGGLPEPCRQFPLPGRGVVRGLVDAAYPAAKTILEADGRTWHGRLDAFSRDRQRDLQAARAGWLTIRFVYQQVVYAPEEMCAAIAEVLTSRGYPVAVGPSPRRYLPAPQARGDRSRMREP